MNIQRMGNALNLEKNYNCFSHKFENRGNFVCVLKFFFIEFRKDIRYQNEEQEQMV